MQPEQLLLRLLLSPRPVGIIVILACTLPLNSRASEFDPFLVADINASGGSNLSELFSLVI